MRMGAQVVGARELGGRLIGLGRAATSQIEAAVLAGGELIADEARRLAPQRTGRGARSIAARLVGRRDPTRATAMIGPGRQEFYLVFHEIGFHAGANRKRGIPGRWVPARPFLRPALDTRERAAIRAAGEVWRRGIDAYLRREGRRAV